MGTVFTIDIRDRGLWSDAVSEVVTWLHHVDGVFSTYKQDSDISGLRRGDLTVADADPEVAPALALCAQLKIETGGYFSAFEDEELDPSGLVKGWAIERTSQILRGHGSHNHAVNGGGDIQIAGEAAPGRPWAVGISDPSDHTRLLTTLTGRDFAIATSGVGERGRHIINPHTRVPAADLASVTITGPSLTRADPYATAAFAMGRNSLGWIEAVPGYEALLVWPDGTMATTSGFPGKFAESRAPADERNGWTVAGFSYPRSNRNGRARERDGARPSLSCQHRSNGGASTPPAPV